MKFWIISTAWMLTTLSSSRSRRNSTTSSTSQTSFHQIELVPPNQIQNSSPRNTSRNVLDSVTSNSKSGSEDEALGLRSGNPHQDGNPGVGKATGFHEKRSPTKRTSNQKLSISAHFGFRIKEKCKTVLLSSGDMSCSCCHVDGNVTFIIDQSNYGNQAKLIL